MYCLITSISTNLCPFLADVQDSQIKICVPIYNVLNYFHHISMILGKKDACTYAMQKHTDSFTSCES